MYRPAAALGHKDGVGHCTSQHAATAPAVHGSVVWQWRLVLSHHAQRPGQQMVQACAHNTRGMLCCCCCRIPNHAATYFGEASQIKGERGICLPCWGSCLLQPVPVRLPDQECLVVGTMLSCWQQHLCDVCVCVAVAACAAVAAADEMKAPIRPEFDC